jgi:hypothetical protein
MLYHGMALQRKYSFPKANLQMLSPGKARPNEIIRLIRIASKVYGPVTEEIRGDFGPNAKGKIKELLQMSAKEIIV